MAEGARIYSTDALTTFRAAMIKFAESGNVALSSADSDIDRVLGWLERDQTSYWAMQVRKRHATALQWEDAVRQKRLFKNVDGTTKSAVDEQKALQKAKRDEEEAVQKAIVVKKWIGVLRKESMMFKGRVQRLASSLQSDVPHAIHSLDNMMSHIEAYLAIQTAGQGISLGDSSETIARAAASEKVGLQRLRDRTPSGQARQDAPFTLLGADHVADHPMRQVWKIGVMQEWQKKALEGLSIDRQLPDPDARVVLAEGVWQSSRIYLERLEPTGDADSGWYLGTAEETAGSTAASYIAVRLGDVVQSRPDLNDFFSLPTGSLIVLDSGGPAAIFDQLGLDIWSLALIKAGEPAPATGDQLATEGPTAGQPAAGQAGTEQSDIAQLSTAELTT
jgi:hypothetical protein